MRVEAIGARDAKIMLIGEAPGETEEKQGVPFVGQAGRVLDGILEEVGLARASCYITNVLKWRPPGNDISKADQGQMAEATAELIGEIISIKPNLIVLLGNIPMEAVLGHGGVGAWRGSVIESKYGKCIPAYHPAAIAREWKFRPLTVLDFIKAKAEGEYPEVRRIRRDLIVRPTYNEIMEYLCCITQDEGLVAFDIEVETRQITCISLAISPTTSMSIPFWWGSSGSFWDAKQEQAIWWQIKQVLENEQIKKVAQNAQYDMTILEDLYGIHVKGLWLDTMIGFHSVYPELPKNLGLLTSIYTDVPYYKYLRKTDDMDAFFGYNAMDSAVTYECATKIMAEMEEFGVKEFYYEHMHSLIEPLMGMTRKGVRIDSVLKKSTSKQIEQEIVALDAKLLEQVGHPLNPNSPKQMKAWLYDELKLPLQYKLRKAKGEKTVAADEEALENLYKQHQIEAIHTILEIRERRKLLSTYLEVTYDKEKAQSGEVVERARTSYLITGTETGRLSSRETVYGTGTNMQNIPKGIVRRIFIPDPGQVFVNADLSQAEARVVAYLAGEDRLISVFNNGGDIHCKNAANIFHKKEAEVTKEERELAKRIVHASNYGMGPITFSRNAGVSVAEARRLLNQYFAEYPRIKLWHMTVATQLKRSRTLTTPLGRKRTFFNMWNESLIKEALAYVPQSTVADVLNMGLRKLHEQIREKRLAIDLLLQVHDSILCQTPRDDVEKTCALIRDALLIPVNFGARRMVIPCEVSVGMSWDELRKV